MSAETRREMPGHIRKAYRSIERFLPVVDVIVELLDARMPRSSRLPALIQRLRKPSVIALGKADLADPLVTAAWIEHFANLGIPCLELDSRRPASANRINELIRRVPVPPTQERKLRRLMVLGIPNVGKSTFINALAGRRAAKAANMPGVTRDIQWIKLPGSLELLDLPGILDYALLTRGEDLRLINSLPGPADDLMMPAERLCALLGVIGRSSCLPGSEQLATSFGHFLEGYAAHMNFLCRGSLPDLDRAAVDLVRRFQQAGFGRISLEAPGDIPAV